MSLVSIGVPVYNGEKYLRESLDSIVNQTYRNLEILIVDDQSKDDSISIVKEYQKKDDRIRIVENKKNLGLVGNWNKCLEEARGEYIKLHFQDDVMMEDTIQKMLDFATSNAVDLVISNRNYIFENVPNEDSRNSFYQEQLPKLSHFVKDDSVIEPAFLANLIARIGLKWNFMGEPILGLMKTSVIDDLGSYDDTFYQIGDFEFWLRIGLNKSFGFLTEELHTFRHHQDSQSAKNASNREINLSFLDRIHLSAKMDSHDSFQELRKFNPSFAKKTLRKYWKENSKRYGKEKLMKFISPEYKDVVDSDGSLWKKLTRKFV